MQQQKDRYGVVTMCTGVGMEGAGTIEREVQLKEEKS